VADIFISYSKQQPQPTHEVAAYLKSQGYSVWWDTDLTAGEIFRDVIDRELDAAKAVIVIWTKHSVASKWVLAEADHADRDGKLIPLRTRDLDAWRIPKPFSTYHADVVDNREAILAAVRRVVARPAVREDVDEADRGMPDKARPRALSPEPVIQSGTPHKLGTTFKDIDIGPEMAVVPAGEFMMGSADGEGENYERPQHKVAIKSAFAVSVSPVTRGEFAVFIVATSHNIQAGAYAWTVGEWKRDADNSWRDPGFRQDDDHPVVCVSWHDAQAYAAWLKKQSGGKAYRLLSEAEWEYCCRAGTTTAFSTGDTITAEQANFGQNASGTTSVFKFAPNPWGLRDMHGNVFEWCEDNWRKTYSGNPPMDGSVWRGGDESHRVVRGGSWYRNTHYLRSAYRYKVSPVEPNIYGGFRVARAL
jgi:formylglycine-generating enzyme required for sulfatase activity